MSDEGGCRLLRMTKYGSLAKDFIQRMSIFPMSDRLIYQKYFLWESDSTWVSFLEDFKLNLWYKLVKLINVLYYSW